MAHAHPSLYSYSTVPAPLLLKSNAQVRGSPSRTAELGQHIMPSSGAI